jgi:cytosine/adenosine deaminase-related metal-dependent hydrolase
MDAGVPLLLGTDNGLLNSPNMLAELDFTYRIAKSQYANSIDPDPRAILAMATSNLRSLKLNGFPGYLEQGLPANCLVIDGTAPHLRHSRNLHASLLCRTSPADVLATFRQGRPLYQRPARPA